MMRCRVFNHTGSTDEFVMQKYTNQGSVWLLAFKHQNHYLDLDWIIAYLA